MNQAEKIAPPAWSPASALRGPAAAATIDATTGAPREDAGTGRPWSGLESRESATPIDEIVHELNGVVHSIRLLAHSAERSGVDPSFQAEVPSLMRKSVERVQRCVDRLETLRGRTS